MTEPQHNVSLTDDAPRVRQALPRETALDPDQPIIDAHHHLYDRPELRYLLPEFRADLLSGHNVRSTVFMQARSNYLGTAPAEMRPVGETAFAARIAQEARHVPDFDVDVCAAIVGYADMMLGDRVQPVLEAHCDAGEGRFRGVRHILAWDADSALLNPAYPTSAGLIETDGFRAAFARLAPLGLSFDAWMFFHQLPGLARLARDFPDTRIIVNHCGGMVGLRGYHGRRDDVFRVWADAITDLAACPNVWMKIGGFGMELMGFRQELGGRPASSENLARVWRPWVETCIAAFGPSRCMFESNFPVDSAVHSYSAAWNAKKRLAAGMTRTEKDDLFWRSASRAYRIAPAGERKTTEETGD